MLAEELGADVNVARRGGLLHDLGKAIDQEAEGTHALIGAEMARRHGVSPAVVHCIEAHHEEVEPRIGGGGHHPSSPTPSAAAGRAPAASRWSSTSSGFEALEAVASSFEGVEKCFAIQAGREIRIIVKPDDIDDLGAMRLAKDISKKIEEIAGVPGADQGHRHPRETGVEYAK